MSGETCGTCFHWKEAEKDLGECRNTSPSVVPTAIEKVAESENNSRKKYHAVFKLMTLWPRTHRSETACGAYVPKK